MEIKPGQVWKWQTPNGQWREMIISRISMGPFVARAFGHHPRTGKQCTCPLSIFKNGMYNAELLLTINDYKYVAKSTGAKCRKGFYDA